MFGRMRERRFDLASARRAAEHDETALWVGDFLASRGSDNEVLASALGALRAHRDRKHQAATHAEIDAEARYETSLRRILGDQFDALYTHGLALDESEMIALAFTHLDDITKT
jgi:aryl-alcohol dehydrogenase-like predicted oxidoreductase